MGSCNYFLGSYGQEFYFILKGSVDILKNKNEDLDYSSIDHDHEEKNLDEVDEDKDVDEMDEENEEEKKKVKYNPEEIKDDPSW